MLARGLDLARAQGQVDFDPESQEWFEGSASRGALSLARARLRIGKAVPGAHCARCAASVPDLPLFDTRGSAKPKNSARAIGAKASELCPRARVRRKGARSANKRRRRSPRAMSGSTDTGYRVTRIERPVETAG